MQQALYVFNNKRHGSMQQALYEFNGVRLYRPNKTILATRKIHNGHRPYWPQNMIVYYT